MIIDIEICSDGKIKVSCPGSFTKEKHQDADDFLKMIEELAGGETVKTKLTPQTLSNKTQQKHQHKH